MIFPLAGTEERGMATWLVVLSIVTLIGACLFLWRWRGHRKNIGLMQAARTTRKAGSASEEEADGETIEEERAEELANAAKWMMGFATACFIVATAALFLAFWIAQPNAGGVAPPQTGTNSPPQPTQ
jgi:hypothetical protein